MLDVLLKIKPDAVDPNHTVCMHTYSGGFRVVPRVLWNPSFMKKASYCCEASQMLIMLYFNKLTRSVGPVDYTQD